MPPVSCEKKKKNFPFLSLWRCWAAHYSCGYFNACGNTEKKRTHRAPLWPPSLWNKTKENTPLGRDLSKAKFQEFPFLHLSSALTSFDKSLGKGKDRHGWVKWWRNATCESQCWCLTWAQLQTGIIDGYLFITICHLQECASRRSCLLNPFLIATHLASLEFPNTACSRHHLSSVKVQAVIVSSCITLIPVCSFGRNMAKIMHKPVEKKDSPCVLTFTDNEKAAHYWSVKL